jgi:branched-chain amino acid transport system substrate-binding protein
VHYAYDTTALGNGTATTILNDGGKTWFFVTADYAFGTQLQDSAARVVTANGGKVIGAVRVPLSTPDFASYVLQAQSSGAQVLGLANAGPDFSNALKAANELGVTKTMKPAALLAFITDIRALGLETAQGLYLTTPWYWDLNDKTRAFAKRFLDKVGREPTFIQAADYSATMTYLSAVKAAGSTDPDKVMDELRKNENQRHVHRGRDNPRRRSHGAFDVRHAGQEPVGVEISLGLLPDRPKNDRRAGFWQTRGFDLPAGQEVTLR